MRAMTTLGNTLAPVDVGRGDRPGAAQGRQHAWPVYLAALGVLAVVVTAVIEIIAALLGTATLRSAVAGQPHEVNWSAPSVQLASMVLGGVGIILSSLALLPLRRRWLALWADDPRFVGGRTRDDVAHELTAFAGEVDGVARARVVLTRRGAEVWVTPAPGRGDADTVIDAVRDHVQRGVEELAPAYALRVRCRAAM